MKTKAERWWNYSMESVEKLSAHNEDWNQLTEREQEVAVLWKLEADVFNGGFIQFFATGDMRRIAMPSEAWRE